MRLFADKHIINAAAAVAVMLVASASAPAHDASRLSARMRVVMPGADKAVAHTYSEAAKRLIGAFLTVSSDFDTDLLRPLGVKTGARAGDVLTARIPADAIDKVAALPGVLRIDATYSVDYMLDEAKASAGLPYEVTDNDGVTTLSSGKGVVVGVIDAGFDYTHETFRDTEGRCRISRVWEQAGTLQTATTPEPYGYGIELVTPEQIAEAIGDVQGNSHGTHVAGIAAGSSQYAGGKYAGLAPESEIVLVSMGPATSDNANLADAIDYIFNYAETLGKPCVINMSLGAHGGPHDGTSPFDRMADSLSGPGRLLVGSAGNHGADSFHVSADLTSESDPLSTFIAFRKQVNKTNAGGTLEVWGEAGMDYSVELLCYSQGKNEVVQSIPVDMDAQEAKEYSFTSNVSGPLTVAVETNPVNGKLHVVLKSEIYSLRSRYLVGLKVTPLTDGHVDIWADNTYLGLDDYDVSGFSGPGPEDSTIAEIGGTAQSILTVGAYTTRSEYTVYGKTDTSNIGQTLGDICSFSSFGPTADGRQKPEITAPGCFIISAVSSNDNSGTQILADVNPDGNYRYGYMQGTSMAAPFVTGVVAGWLQLDPTLDPVRLHGTVAATAVKDDFVSGGEPRKWGAGKINPKAGALQVLCSSVQSVMNTSGNGALISGKDVVFTGAGRYELVVTNMSGMIVGALRIEANAGDIVPINEFELDHGLYIVSVSGAQGRLAGKVAL